MHNLKVYEKKSLKKCEFFILDEDGERLWDLKKEDSIIKRLINFNLRVKLPSTYFLYKDQIVTHTYEKRGKRIYIKEIESGKVKEIAYFKKLSERFYMWDNSQYEISSALQTSVVIKENNQTIGDIYFQQTKSGLKENEIVISLQLINKKHNIIPIIILLYVNEFYQDRIGQAIK